MKGLETLDEFALEIKYCKENKLRPKEELYKKIANECARLKNIGVPVVRMNKKLGLARETLRKKMLMFKDSDSNEFIKVDIKDKETDSQTYLVLPNGIKIVNPSKELILSLL